MVDIARGIYCTWYILHMAYIAHDIYCTWQILHMADIAHGRYCTWQIIDGLVAGRKRKTEMKWGWKVGREMEQKN
jgi:hypothetical protein